VSEEADQDSSRPSFEGAASGVMSPGRVIIEFHRAYMAGEEPAHSAGALAVAIVALESDQPRAVEPGHNVSYSQRVLDIVEHMLSTANQVEDLNPAAEIAKALAQKFPSRADLVFGLLGTAQDSFPGDEGKVLIFDALERIAEASQVHEGEQSARAHSWPGPREG